MNNIYKTKIKKVIIEIYDTLMWVVLLGTIWILTLYLTLPIITFYFNMYKIKSLSKDFASIWNRNFRKQMWIPLDIKTNNTVKATKVNITHLNDKDKIISKLNNDKDQDKYNSLNKLRRLIEKSRNKNLWKKDKTPNPKKKTTKTNANKLDKYPIKDFIFNSKKIYINGESSNVVYRDISKNIQRDLWKYSVISSFYWTPIIFTHSSGWKYNFWLYYLNLTKGWYVYLEWKYDWVKYYIEWTVMAIYRNIHWYNLYKWLVDIRYKHNYNKEKVFFLDTCELNWTKRRITVIKIKNIYIK